MPLDDATYVKLDNIDDILGRARKLIAEHWVQCPIAPNAPDGYCIVGAVGATIRAMERETSQPLMGLFDAAIDRLEVALSPIRRATGALSLAQYNDAPGRTLEDMLKLFDMARVGNQVPL